MHVGEEGGEENGDAEKNEGNGGEGEDKNKYVNMNNNIKVRHNNFLITVSFL
jgi:hypothetical protein